jgi:hypothetical protein
MIQTEASGMKATLPSAVSDPITATTNEMTNINTDGALNFIFNLLIVDSQLNYTGNCTRHEI